MTTLSEFIQQNKLLISSERVVENPNMPNSKDMRHYKVTVTIPLCPAYGIRKFTVCYSMGSALKGEPELLSVLGNLQMDISSVSGTFEDFCDEFGYDSDSRKVEKLYNAILKQKADLEIFFAEMFEEFMNCENDY